MKKEEVLFKNILNAFSIKVLKCYQIWTKRKKQTFSRLKQDDNLWNIEVKI